MSVNTPGLCGLAQRAAAHPHTQPRLRDRVQHPRPNGDEGDELEPDDVHVTRWIPPRTQEAVGVPDWPDERQIPVAVEGYNGSGRVQGAVSRSGKAVRTKGELCAKRGVQARRHCCPVAMEATSSMVRPSPRGCSAIWVTTAVPSREWRRSPQDQCSHRQGPGSSRGHSHPSTGANRRWSARRSPPTPLRQKAAPSKPPAYDG
jgi:hypothetical protein